MGLHFPKLFDKIPQKLPKTAYFSEPKTEFLGCPILKNNASAKINVIIFEKLDGASLNDHQ